MMTMMMGVCECVCVCVLDANITSELDQITFPSEYRGA